ncbi:MAG: hypothetical protein M3016_06380 [Actinomycetota bacterium]|nr:hypothetical protein [Actinomycetota bacterium]
MEVEVLLEVGGLVAVLEVVGLVLVVLGALEVVGLELVLLGEAVDEVLAELLEQSRAASWLMRLAPWSRFLARVWFTLEGRAATSLLKACAALSAAPHWPAETAEDTALSWALRLLAWLESSRPFWPPQATTNATAKPRPPARNAREPWPIRA